MKKGMPIKVKVNVSEARRALENLGTSIKRTNCSLKNLGKTMMEADHQSRYTSDDLRRAWAKHERAKKYEVTCQPNYADPEVC
ncbi:hypothetical protein LCGC14_3005450 [marine sediment metagenome]|uniref:Uncharacterized protein n=1 Tax=marine sediment metagenome TaxID=412755 RepID=A0A0F8XMG4_9ZZZZ